MGVGFFPCDYCSETICDCGPYVRCNEDCGRTWCNEKCAKADGWIKEYIPEPNPYEYATKEEYEKAYEEWELFIGKVEEETGYDYKLSCKYCRDEDIDDTTLLAWVLKHHLDMTREEAVKHYFQHGTI